MPISKQRFTHLHNTKLALIAYFKKQKLEEAHCFNTKQFCINNNKLNTGNIGNIGNKNIYTDTDTDEEETWC